jgi:isopenicillin-N N-acyltransferase-like protein
LISNEIQKPVEAAAAEIVLEGDNYEMGFQCGTQWADLIRSAIETNYKITSFYSNLTRTECIANVQKFLPVLKEQVPDLCEEMKGIADGSNILFEDIVVLNFHSRDLARGCTIFFVGGELTVDGSSITGQTIDWTPSLKQYYRVVHQKVRGRPQIIQFTIPGILGLAGKNDKGLNVLMSILLTSEETQLGVPAYLMLRRAMEAEDLEEGVKILRNKKRASAFNYMLSDNTGRVCDVEAGPSFFFEHRNGNDPFFVHTNHCLSQELKAIDTYVQATRSNETLTRYSKMREMLQEKSALIAKGGEKLTLQDIFALIRDHHNFPDSICRHPRKEVREEGRLSTMGVIVSRQNEEGLWILHRNPCEGRPQFFGFS